MKYFFSTYLLYFIIFKIRTHRLYWKHQKNFNFKLFVKKRNIYLLKYISVNLGHEFNVSSRILDKTCLWKQQTYLNIFNQFHFYFNNYNFLLLIVFFCVEIFAVYNSFIQNYFIINFVGFFNCNYTHNYRQYEIKLSEFYICTLVTINNCL